MKRLILLLTVCLFIGQVFGAVNDVKVQTETADGTLQPLTLQSSGNQSKAAGFSAAGVFGPRTLLELLPSGNALQYFRRNAANNGFEFVDTSLPSSPNFSGTVTLSGPGLQTPLSVMGALVWDVSKALNVKTDNASRTITSTGTLLAGQYSEMLWVNTATNQVTITLPAGWKDGNTGAPISTFTVPAAIGADNGRRHVAVGTTDGTDRFFYQGGGSGGTSSEPIPFAQISERPTTLSGYGITDAQLFDALLESISALSPPAGDRVLGYDVSSGGFSWFEVRNNLSVTDTYIDAVGGGGGAITWNNLLGGTALTIGTNYFDALTAGRTFTFVGTPANGDTVRAKFAVASGPVTINIPSSLRVGNTTAETSLVLADGTHLLTWQYINGQWVLSDSAVDQEAAYTVYGNFSGGLAAPDFTASGVLDFSQWTSFKLPVGATPVVDATGKIAFDTNQYASSRGAFTAYDGTEGVVLLAVPVSDVPTAGQVPVYQAGGRILWEDQTGGGGGAGDVTAASPFGTDNRVVRSDGTGKGLQASLVEINDTGDISTPGTLTVTGTTTDTLSVTTVSNAVTQKALDAVSTTQGTILYRNADDWVSLAPGVADQFLQTKGAGQNPQWATPPGGGGGAGSFGITVDGGGAVLTSGSKGFVTVPFACTITGWSIIADQAGSVAFDVEKAADGTIPTTSIVASAAPSLSSDQIERSTTLTGWTTSVSANDVVEFEITGTPATITRATLQISYTK